MFLLERIDLLALLGLLTQAGTTWIFLSVFLILRRGSERPDDFHTWSQAFAALAIGLTAISVRFFYSFDSSSMPVALWSEGEPLVRLSYALYLGGKVLFGLLLVRGAGELAGASGQRWFGRVAPVALALAVILPALGATIHTVLLIQAPVMVVCSLLAARHLFRAGRKGAAGIRLVRFTLAGVALTWIVHTVSVSWAFIGASAFWETMRALNSYLDLALELPLGAGLIAISFEEARERLREAQASEARMRLEIERDERLRALGGVVSGVAHELNNPLTAILGFSEELAAARDPAYSAQVIHEQAERCRGIVRSLSALAGGQSCRRKPHDPAAMARRVARGFEPQVAATGVKLELEIGPAAPVSVDVFEIEQVLTNLLSNAIQATPSGKRVFLRLCTRGGRTVFEVEDEGPGISEADRARVFEPFFSTKPLGTGIGLGLAVAFAIVRSHGGQMELGPPGALGGARFHFDLPGAAESVAVEAAGRPARSSGRTLLIVEDDHAVRTIVRRRAEHQGWHVSAAPCGEDALEVLGLGATRATVTPDVLLCDLRMPGIGGAGLYRALVAQRPELAPRCLFFTGDLASPDAVAFASEIQDTLIGKPLDFAELFSRMERLASRGDLPTPPRREPTGKPSGQPTR